MTTAKGGRPVYVPVETHRTAVAVMAACGFTHVQIAARLNINKDTLTKYYREALDQGKAEANALVAQSLFKKATSDGNQSVAAAIFWMKAQAGWREVVEMGMTEDVKTLVHGWLHSASRLTLTGDAKVASKSH